MLAVLALTDRLLTAHVEAAAQSQADDAAQVLSGRFARVLERRVEDLQPVTRSVALAYLDKPVELRAKPDRLGQMAPVYRSVAVASRSGIALRSQERCAIDLPRRTAVTGLRNRRAHDLKRLPGSGTRSLSRPA